MAVDTSIIGRATGRSRVVLERQPLTNFAKAVKDDSPVYTDPRVAAEAGFEGIPAPPTFSMAMEGWGKYAELQDDIEPVEGNPMFETIGKLMQTGGLVLHGEQEFVYHRTPRAGDVLRSEGRITDAYEKESKGKTMTFVVSETVWSDDETGEPVVTSIFNLIHRS